LLTVLLATATALLRIKEGRGRRRGGKGTKAKEAKEEKEEEEEKEEKIAKGRKE